MDTRSGKRRKLSASVVKIMAGSTRPASSSMHGTTVSEPIVIDGDSDELSDASSTDVDHDSALEVRSTSSSLSPPPRSPTPEPYNLHQERAKRDMGIAHRVARQRASKPFDPLRHRLPTPSESGSDTEGSDDSRSKPNLTSGSAQELADRPEPETVDVDKSSGITDQSPFPASLRETEMPPFQLAGPKSRPHTGGIVVETSPLLSFALDVDETSENPEQFLASDGMFDETHASDANGDQRMDEMPVTLPILPVLDPDPYLMELDGDVDGVMGFLQALGDLDDQPLTESWGLVESAHGEGIHTGYTYC